MIEANKRNEKLKVEVNQGARNRDPVLRNVRENVPRDRDQWNRVRDDVQGRAIIGPVESVDPNHEIENDWDQDLEAAEDQGHCLDQENGPDRVLVEKRSLIRIPEKEEVDLVQ